MKRLALPVLLVLAACDSGVPKVEAQKFLGDVESIARDAPAANMVTSLLMTACADVPSCAKDCAEAFRSAPRYPENDQRLLVAQCSADFREATNGPAKLSLGTWVRRYIGRYVEKARHQLDTAECARLDEAFRALGH